METDPPPTASHPRTSWFAALVVAAAVFIATAPTLVWLEFSSGMENLVVATALEIRRTGVWLVPTLEGEPRVAKPPLAAWFAAATIRPSTFAALDDPDPARRDAGYRALACDVRWPALAASCAMLLAVFDLGKTLARSPRVGFLAMVCCGTSLYFLRFGRQATTDVQLALWVAVANAAVARAIFASGGWGAAAVAGAALGLALMSKGPVALLQTALPAALFLGWRRRTGRRPEIRPAQIVAAAALMLLIGGGWYVIVAARSPAVFSRWWIELARSGAGERAGNPFSYASLLAYMLPWTPVLIHGLIWTAVEATAAWRQRAPLPRDAEGMVFALLVVAAPVLVMSFFPDRKERYLLPLTGAMSILAARGLTATLNPADPRRVPPWVMWLTFAVLALGLPIAGRVALRRTDGSPWYPLPFALGAAAIMATIVVACGVLARRGRATSLVVGGAAVMLALAPLLYLGYRDSRQGRSELRPLAEVIRRVAPDARMYYWRPQGIKRAPVDVSIYLNRPTTWIPQPASLERTREPQVLLAQQRRTKDASPMDPPPGWIPLHRVPRDDDWFLAFVRQDK